MAYLKEEPIGQISRLPVGSDVPLCVDLDGTLISSDTLWEGLWLALRTNPFRCLWALLSLLRGRAALKRRIASLAVANPKHLPYRQDVLAFLSSESRAGRSLILVTAADASVARGVAAHLGLFDRIVASDGVINRKGDDKLSAIRNIAPEFIYVGDSTADLPVWKASAGAIVVGNNRSVLKELRRSDVTIYRHFPSSSNRLAAVLRAIRVHQWLKNLLVLVPIFLGHRTRDIGVWKAGLLALAVFSIAASLAYVLNDLLDLEADRLHSKKRTRPFASGTLSIPAGLLLLLALGSTAVVLSAFLTVSARLWIAAYFAGTLFYSLHLKTRLLADVVGLAMLYALRVMTGGAATAIVISPWTLAFCVFFFFSLALIKRFGELLALPDHQPELARRAYRKSDLAVISSLGVSSGVLSVVVFAMYINSPEVRVNYSSPALLWLACPVMLYWFGRLWILANRGNIAEDPLLYSFKDKISYIAGVCMALIWLAASIYP